MVYDETVVVENASTMNTTNNGRKFPRYMVRLNSVKNTNFGLENKKSFLTHSKIVFGVTDHFCIK